MPCAPDSKRSVSLGCFIEHDTSEARVRVAADVLQTRGCTKDLGFIIPQTTLPEDTINSIVKSVGQALLTEQCVGFFGIDIVVFQDTCSPKHELDYWVVDIDPYYTDLISFDDWRRFCLDSPNSQSFSEKPPSPANDGDNRQRALLFGQDDRFVVCSGKLYTDGLSHCSGSSLVELLDRRHLSYSPKARTGCMICPIDNDSTTLLLFSFCRGRQLALQRFVQALYALRSAATSCKRKSTKRPPLGNLTKLICDLEKAYDIDVPASRR